MELVYNFDESTIPLWVKVLFGGLYMVVFVYTVWKTLILVPKDKRKVTASGFILLYFTAYAMFYCVNPDYFSYREWLGIRPEDIIYWTNEQVYLSIIVFCQSLKISYPLELFRLIVWGGGLLIVLLTAKMYRSLLSPNLVILFLFVFYAGTFSYARASLAMAIYFMGVSIILWGNNFFVKTLGFAIAICSFFFHHEMIIAVGVLPSLLIPFENKKSLLFSIILLGIMVAAIMFVNSHLSLLESLMGGDSIAQKMENYNERENGIFRASTFVNYFNFFYPFILISVFFYRHKETPKAIAGIYRITFVLLLATIAYMVVDGMRSTYVYRILYITIIPMAILIAYCFNQGYFKKYQFLLMLLLACITNLMRLIQSF